MIVTKITKYIAIAGLCIGVFSACNSIGDTSSHNMKNVSKFKAKIEAGKNYDDLKEFIDDLDEDGKSEFESNLKKFSEGGKNIADIAGTIKNRDAADILKGYGIFPANPKNSSKPLIEELPDASQLLPEGAPLVLQTSVRFVDLPSDLNSTINNLKNPVKPNEPNKELEKPKRELVVHVPNFDTLPALVPVIAQGEEDKQIAIVLQNIANQGNALQKLDLGQDIESIGNVENIDKIESLDIVHVKKEIELYDKSQDNYIKNLERPYSEYEKSIQDTIRTKKFISRQEAECRRNCLISLENDNLLENSVNKTELYQLNKILLQECGIFEILTPESSYKVNTQKYRLLGGMPKYLDLCCGPYGKYYDYRIRSIIVKSVWIGHGFFASIGSSFSWMTGNSVTHWWVELETDYYGVWFCAQFGRETGSKFKSNIDLKYCESSEEVTTLGLRAAGREGDDPNITIKINKPPLYYTTVGDIYNWMNSSDCSSNYNVISNNCQDFANELCERFLGETATCG